MNMTIYKSLLEQKLNSFPFLTKTDKANLNDEAIKDYYKTHKEKHTYFKIRTLAAMYMDKLGFQRYRKEFGIYELLDLIKYRFGALVKRDRGLKKISKRSYRVIR